MSRVASTDFFGQSGADFVKLFGAFKRQVTDDGKDNFPDAGYTVRGPSTLDHRLRITPRSGDQWTTVALVGGEKYRLDSIVYISGVATAVFIPLDTKLAKQFAQMRVGVSDAIVLMEGFEEFVEALLEWGEEGVIQQIEREKKARLAEMHQAAMQAARERSREAEAIYGQDWGAF